MRLLLSFLLPLLLAAAPARDWTATAARTPTGTFLIGNPAAPVKLVEYASFTCPHCAAFSGESAPVLRDRWVRGGSVSLEIRNLVRDPIDLAAVVVARCTGTRGFAATSADIFARQNDWLPRAFAYQQANAARLQMYPELGRIQAVADGAGLSDIGRTHGLSDAQLAACFADGAEVNRILAITAATPPTVTGTPSFFVNGRQARTFDWSGLQPILRAAGAK